MGKISKQEQLVIENAKIFNNLVNEIKDIDYILKGFLANIIYNRFRACSYFEIQVSQLDKDKLVEIYQLGKQRDCTIY